VPVAECRRSDSPSCKRASSFFFLRCTRHRAS
jgi:hypothetical protein